MTTFSNSPRLTKGAIVALDPFNPLASVVVFQYNPAELTRSLTAPSAEKTKGAVVPPQRNGPPRATVSLKVILDASDQLAAGDSQTALLGIYPQLSALEMLLYPKTLQVIATAMLAKTGTMEIRAPEPPLTLFLWGYKRVVPVRVESISITEQYFDPNLNPVMAEVDLSLRMLSYADFNPSQPGYYLALAHQAVQEAMATLGSVNNVAGVVSGDVSRF